MSDLENGVGVEDVELTQENIDADIEQTGSSLEEYQKYLDNDLRVSANDFMYKCGLLTTDMYEVDPIKFINKVNTQMNQVTEELSEILEATDLNSIEHMDGHVDSMFVIFNFIEMNKYLPKVDEDLLSEHLNINKLQLIGNIFEHIISYPLPLCATSENMIESAKRIVDNNRLKYTTDLEVAESWKLPTGGRKDGIKLQAIEFEGITYYSLVDKNGKIRKHKYFNEVDLSDLTVQEK